MYDAITAANIPASARVVAGYVDGRWPSYFDLPRTHPDALHVSIAVDPAQDAQVLDCERFDATPADCPGWAVRQRRRGQVPTIYCNTSSWPAVVDQFRVQRVPLAQWWEANYDRGARLLPGRVGVQYTDHADLYDISVILDQVPGWDHLATHPRPQPTPPPQVGPPRYRVQPGDTLTGLAARFHVSVAALVSWNGIRDADVIRVGQVLIVGPDPRLHRPTLLHAVPPATKAAVHPAVLLTKPATPPPPARPAAAPTRPLVSVPAPAPAPTPTPAPAPARQHTGGSVNKGPLQVSNPAWWAMVATVVLAALGINDPSLSTAVQGVAAGVAGLVVSVFTVTHHKNVRNADSAAAAIRVAAITAARPAAASATPAGAPPLPPEPAPAAPPASS